ncbi:MAG: L,D-transpeptidase family protein [Burkholderiales bacterium]|nr:L,D-transpeptidase family protein [Anaerolineae bacterium]
MPWLIVGGAVAAGFAMLMALVAVVAVLLLSEDRIASGVAAAGLPIGDHSVDEATEMLQQGLAAQTVTAMDGSRSWPLSLADLGVTLNVEATMQLAENAAANSQVQPVYSVDLNQAQTALVNLSEEANIDAVPGDPPQIGRSMEIPVMLDRLRRDTAGELADGILELNMIEVEPPEDERLSSYTGETTTHIVERGQELALIARQYGVTIDDLVTMNGLSNPDVIWIGQELIVPAGGEYVPANIPPAPRSSGRSILVDTSQQRIYAYENGEMVHSHLVSTGLPATPTVLGDYSVYVKYVADDMSGPDYFLPQVPYTMYFFQGYGIHGTYWHNSFGRPMSHGCVNLPTSEAEWFFNFASVGTPVRVI